MSNYTFSFPTARADKVSVSVTETKHPITPTIIDGFGEKYQTHSIKWQTHPLSYNYTFTVEPVLNNEELEYITGVIIERLEGTIIEEEAND